MGTAKWIAGLLGWVAFGPIGALLGVIAGSVIEGAVEAAHQISGGAAPGGAQGGGYRGGYGASEQRNSFLVSLLVLSSAVIRADGKTLQAHGDEEPSGQGGIPRPGRAEGCRREIPKDPGGV